jgi:hypothetical protein
LLCQLSYAPSRFSPLKPKGPRCVPIPLASVKSGGWLANSNPQHLDSWSGLAAASTVARFGHGTLLFIDEIARLSRVNRGG